MIIETVDQRGADLAWHGYTLITDPSRTTWDQRIYRSSAQCGTACCYASHLALAAGGRWLVDIDPDEDMWIDGTPVTNNDEVQTRYRIEDYMLATDDDPHHLVETVREHKVIHVKFRAAHLIGLAPEGPHELGGLFDPDHSASELATLLEEQFSS